MPSSSGASSVRMKSMPNITLNYSVFCMSFFSSPLSLSLSTYYSSLGLWYSASSKTMYELNCGCCTEYHRRNFTVLVILPLSQLPSKVRLMMSLLPVRKRTTALMGRASGTTSTLPWGYWRRSSVGVPTAAPGTTATRRRVLAGAKSGAAARDSTCTMLMLDVSSYCIYI